MLATIKFGDFVYKLCAIKYWRDLNLALKCMPNVRYECVYNIGGFKFGGLLRNHQISKFNSSPNIPDIYTFYLQQGAIHTLAFSPDGKYIASAG